MNTIILCGKISSGPPSWTYIVPVVAALISGGAVFLSYRVFKMQRLMTQRQLIVPLWQYISSLNEIDPNNPITPDIIKAVNTLELVALTCEGGMIDEAVIKRTFSDQFIKHYDNIHKCTYVPGFTNKSGSDLLGENPSAMSFYDKLMTEKKNKNRLK